MVTLDTLRAERREEIFRLAGQRGAHSLRVFGSVARGEANDFDLLVEREPGRSLLDHAGLVQATRTRPAAIISTASTPRPPRSRARKSGDSSPGISIPTIARTESGAGRELAAAALGLRAHSGWAVMVAVSGGSAVLRRRIEMTKGSGYRASQPYHAAQEMKLPQAEAFLQRTEKIAVEMAATAVKDAVAMLASEGYRVAGAAVLLGSGKPLPELARILAAHPLIHTAEGVFFRDVLKSACEACGLAVAGIKERDVLEQCAAALRVPAVELQALLSAMGKTLGPPWTQDEKLSAAAALTIPYSTRG